MPRGNQGDDMWETMADSLATRLMIQLGPEMAEVGALRWLRYFVFILQVFFFSFLRLQEEVPCGG